MNSFNLEQHPHRRFNPLTGEWILVSPHRTERPWQGSIERASVSSRPIYDPECYLCPGNHRAGGRRNPFYQHTFAFDNDFPALLPAIHRAPPDADDQQRSLLVYQPEPGLCRVVCFSPRHDLTLAEMAPAAIRMVVDTWIEETESLAQHEFVSYVQVFENKGELMGCSNPHPHCQIWASGHLPEQPAKEHTRQREHLEHHDSCLLCDYWQLEFQAEERVICDNDHFAVVAPFWAVWPFETMLVAKRHVGIWLEFTAAERAGLADILKRLTCKYDNLFQTSFPYSMGFHQQPVNGGPYPEWHFHAHFYPPLLRSATVRKFMVGYEMLANPQRDITAEQAARRLRQLPEIHFSGRAAEP